MRRSGKFLLLVNGGTCIALLGFLGLKFAQHDAPLWMHDALYVTLAAFFLLIVGQKKPAVQRVLGVCLILLALPAAGILGYAMNSTALGVIIGIAIAGDGAALTAKPTL